MVTKKYKIGAQLRGFNMDEDWSHESYGTRLVKVEDCGDYCILTITRDTADQVESELLGQLSDGIFENEPVYEVSEIS